LLEIHGSANNHLANHLPTPEEFATGRHQEEALFYTNEKREIAKEEEPGR
jgi:hypothetical protein